MRLPVENLETKLVAYHTVAGADVHGWCVFDGRLEVDLLRKAIAALCEEFPVLRSRVVPSWFRPSYETLPDPPPLDVLPGPWEDIYGIPEQVRPFFEYKLDVFRGPLVRFCYVESNQSAYSFLALKHNHCVADGRGMVRIFELLALHYSALATQTNSARVTRRTDRSLRSIYEQFSFWQNRRLGLASIRNWASLFMGARPDRLEWCLD